MSTEHTLEQWRWGFFKHRRDLKENYKGGTCTPFYEFRPISENHEFGNGTVLAVCDYGHILKIEDHWEQCVLASQGGDGGESDILVSDEFADIIAAAPWLLAACKAAIAKFSVKPDSTLPRDVKEQMNRMIQRDPTCQQLVAAVFKAEPKPNITGTPVEDVIRGERSKEALFYKDPAEGGAE